MLNEDPKWNDTNYVLVNYKTEQCKRPPRLCRQGFACPQYHNARDRRRNPSIFKYRSTPCPQVKQGDDWLEPSVCDQADLCKYCHSRTEQQFHPEIYKSSKCNDMIATGYCPRGPFCAFAHVEAELKNHQRANSASDSEYTLESFITNALPQSTSSTSDDAPGSLNPAGADRSSFVSKTIGSSNTTFAGIVLGHGANQSSSNTAQQVASNQEESGMSRTLAQTLANNQLLALVAAATAANNQQLQIQNDFKQQQMMYTKPIGSERERPRSSQQLGGNSSGGSSSASSPTIQLNSGGGNYQEMASFSQSDMIKPQGFLQSASKTSSMDSSLGLGSPTGKAITPPPGVTLNNGILSIASRVGQGQMGRAVEVSSGGGTLSIANLEKDKLIQDLKMQTEMSNKLESLCLQYRHVCSIFTSNFRSILNQNYFPRR